MGKSKKLEEYSSKVLRCGGLVFEPDTGLANANINNRKVLFRIDCGDRILLENLMKAKAKPLSYEALAKLLNIKLSSNTSYLDSNLKTINDKVEALKRKLKLLGFSRDDLKNMFICDRGYRLIPPKEGRRIRGASNSD